MNEWTQLRRSGVLLGLFASLFPTLGASPAHGETLPTGFIRQQLVVFSGTGEPVGFTWLPDGRLLLVSRSPSTVWLTPVGSTTPTQILTVPNVETTDGEQGLLGVAVDPAWPARPYVYFEYTHTGGTSYVTMYTASGALTNPASTAITLASPFHLLTDIPDLIGYHNGGTLRFGADNKLYLSMGDDGDGCSAQDLTKLTGKILRLDESAMPGAGSGRPPKSSITPPDNPFPGPDANTRLVWLWGLRNPFRFTIDRPTGDLFIGDVGEQTQEEMDRIRPVSAGANLGWPQRGFLDPRAAAILERQHLHRSDLRLSAGPLGRRHRRTADAFCEQPASFPASYDGSVFLAEFTGLVPPTRSLRAAVDRAAGSRPTVDVELGRWTSVLVGLAARPGGCALLLPNDRRNGSWRASHPRDDADRLRDPCECGPCSSAGGAEPLASGHARAPELCRQFRCGAVPGASGCSRAGASDLGATSSSGGAIAWDGSSASGVPLASGVYFVLLRESGRTLATEKVTLLK
jgi:glucose/arabinose dehydrogenase